MKKKLIKEIKKFNFPKKNTKYNKVKKELDIIKKKNFCLKVLVLVFILLIIIILAKIILFNNNSLKFDYQNIKELIKIDNERENNKNIYSLINSHINDILMKEKDRPYLEIINKKRTFEKRLPLTKDIKCKPHFSEYELGAFLSFLTKNTIFFQTGSGCSSIIAKYYAKKTYAVEGGIQ